MPEASGTPEAPHPSTLARILELAENAPPLMAVESVARGLREVFGAAAVSFLIIDVNGRALVRLTHITAEADRLGETAPQDGRRDREESAETIPLDGGPFERAVRTQEVQLLEPSAGLVDEAGPGRWRVLAPVTERGEAMGLLELSLAQRPGPEALEEIGSTAHALAFVIIANRRHTDLFEWGQRSIPLSLAAEIQRRLLPAAHTCEGGAFTLAAWLEPASNVGGDTFDYSLGRDILHLSITDAMGHGVASALMATLCVGSLRNTRRQGASLVQQACHANTALMNHVSTVIDEGFVTGLVGQLDLRTAELSLVNAGHVAPYLLRGETASPIDLPVDLPFGIEPDTQYRTTEITLEDGDRLVFVTDGMLERNAASFDLVDGIRTTRHLHPREATRQLADRVAVTAGADHEDDATLLMLDYHHQNGRGRITRAGSD